VWNPAITNQAGGIKLSKGSTIVTYLQTRQEILIWTDASLYSLQYLGPPYVWGNQLLGDNLSIVSPNAVVTANNTVFWMGADKFYMYTGRVETLPSTVRQYVYSNINLGQAYQITVGSLQPNAKTKREESETKIMLATEGHVESGVNGPLFVLTRVPACSI